MKPTINDIIEFFKDYKHDTKPIKLNQCTIADNTESFVKTQLSYLKKNSGNKLFKPYATRLLQLYLILK